jgi:hypothetical protein
MFGILPVALRTVGGFFGTGAGEGSIGGGGGGTPPYTQALKFNDARNSQYAFIGFWP